MSGLPANWNAIATALAMSGCDLTEYGAALARLQTSCGWCSKRLHEGPLSASGQESTGICSDCTPPLRGARQ